MNHVQLSYGHAICIQELQDKTHSKRRMFVCLSLSYIIVQSNDNEDLRKILPPNILSSVFYPPAKPSEKKKAPIFSKSYKRGFWGKKPKHPLIYHASKHILPSTILSTMFWSFLHVHFCFCLVLHFHYPK
ncbi:hypothetical protein SLEP1_g55593 [Rubroshorea leprosula]|uniref:Uncharacterized protein n=1 Tax=Rubroshorea leprosula TaxID=152421 RepID=A0AAV5MFT4_9ROSI|nr:hypothetical protein SLEP1_g55593 [Rubroshorea leprosula]